jgi:molybdopterin converting factor small subunit
MIVNVRVSGVLAQKIGVPRFQVTLPAGARAQDLVTHLADTYPHLSAELARVVIVVGGAHQPETAVLADEQEVALLMPVAGG